MGGLVIVGLLRGAGDEVVALMVHLDSTVSSKTHIHMYAYFQSKAIIAEPKGFGDRIET